MSKLIPKLTNDDAWLPLVQHRDFAVLCNPDESVYFRFGLGRGMFMAIDPSASGRMINEINYESGDPTVLGKLPAETKTILGRTGDCAVKVMNALISRNHLELTFKGNILVVRDLGSTNGTFLFKDIKHFDIENYIENHPVKEAQESTMDWVHEAFGINVDDFLKNYAQSKKEKN